MDYVIEVKTKAKEVTTLNWVDPKQGITRWTSTGKRFISKYINQWFLIFNPWITSTYEIIFIESSYKECYVICNQMITDGLITSFELSHPAYVKLESDKDKIY